jgi:biopolymer transport protein ExbB/TolQ
MPTEIILIVILILLLISIALNITTYLKLEKNKSLILEEMSNRHKEVSNHNNMIQTAMNQAFLDLDKKIERHENEIKEHNNMIQTAMNQAFLDLDKKIERHENEIKELEEKIEHIIKLLKEPLTEEDLR